jgi:hypothetical protein
MTSKGFVTTAQAAKMLGRGINLIAKLCQSGRLPRAEKIGNAWLIPRESVLSYKPMKRGVKPGTPWSKKRKIVKRSVYGSPPKTKIGVSEAAKIMGVSITWVAFLCREGRLRKAEKQSSGAWLISRESVLKYEAARQKVK